MIATGNARRVLECVSYFSKPLERHRYLALYAPTGRHVEYTGITIFRFHDGRCVERWSWTDRLALMQQLGQG